ncbi:MAG: RNA polymerase sigma-70 factor [Cyclobacteriaceae bacterium]
MARDRKDISKYISRVSRHNDQRAFQEIFNVYFERLLSFSISYVRHSASAEDILADVFTNLWVNRKQLKDIGNFDAYIFTCVKNQSLKFLEKKQRYFVKEIDEKNLEDYLINNYTPEAEFEFEELKNKFNQTIDELPNQCRLVFQLVKQQKMKYKDVAEILSISTKTVDAHVVKAVKRLRKSFQNLRPDRST